VDELIAFLKARIVEDEEAANVRPRAGHSLRWTALRVDRPRVHANGRAQDEPTWCVYTDERSGALVAETTDIPANVVDHIARHDPRRVLAEVKSKRAILALADYPDAFTGDNYWRCLEDVLKALATPYSGHADFKEEWRP
jgi:hypothetical protein